MAPTILRMSDVSNPEKLVSNRRWYQKQYQSNINARRAALHQRSSKDASVCDYGLTGKKRAWPVAIDLRRLVGQGSLVGQARVVRNLRHIATRAGVSRSDGHVLVKCQGKTNNETASTILRMSDTSNPDKSITT